MDVIKLSGKREKFNPVKVYRTCLKAGASKKQARQVVEKIKKKIYDGIPTRQILDYIVDYLKKAKQPSLAARYKLKQAMLELGPAGFVFEDFIRRLLESYNWQMEDSQILHGHCIKHEVDLVGYCQKKKYLIECKYHNRAGIRTRAKDSLYVWARFLDLQETGYKFDLVRLVSNTKFSSYAIQYARCKRMQLLGWKYPRSRGLEQLIEKKHFYPITILSSLNKSLYYKLFAHKLILCQDLLVKPRKFLEEEVGLSPAILTRLLKEAKTVLNQ